MMATSDVTGSGSHAECSRSSTTGAGSGGTTRCGGTTSMGENATTVRRVSRAALCTACRMSADGARNTSGCHNGDVDGLPCDGCVGEPYDAAIRSPQDDLSGTRQSRLKRELPQARIQNESDHPLVGGAVHHIARSGAQVLSVG